MKTYDYRAGTDVVVEMGKMRPFGRRILCRSILQNDAYEGPLTLVTYNSTDAVAFEILAVGGAVADWCEQHGETTPIVGQHCDVRSVAADRVNAKDPTGRYWLVPVEDVSAVWDPIPADDALLAAVDAISARSKPAPAPSIASTIILEPGR